MAEKMIDYSKPLKNAKYERFCQEYIVDSNGAKAAIRAGYSKNGAKVKASQLLTIINVKERITYLQAELSKETGITTKRIIEEFAKVGFANIQDYLTEGNEIKDISGIKREVAAAVESIQVDIRHDSGDSEGYTEKVKLKCHSKLSALTDLGKHLGIFERDNRQKTDGLVDLMKEICSSGAGLPIKS